MENLQNIIDILTINKLLGEEPNPEYVRVYEYYRKMFTYLRHGVLVKIYMNNIKNESMSYIYDRNTKTLSHFYHRMGFRETHHDNIKAYISHNFKDLVETYDDNFKTMDYEQTHRIDIDDI